MRAPKFSLPDREWRKYAEFARAGARESLVSSAPIVGRIVFYALLLLIFSRVWEAAYAAGGRENGSPADMLWYLAATEWIILAVPPTHLGVEEDVRSGNLAYQLPRPISYPWMKVAESMGASTVRLFSLGLAGFAFAWFFSGRLPQNTAGFLYILPLGLLAVLINVIFHVAIGISGFWLQDASPVSWVWQKLSFILGGLIIPLTLYPSWLKAIAFATPFAAILYGPGETLLTGNAFHAALTLAAQLFWLLVAIVFLNWIFGRGCRALEINGG